MRVGYVVKCFPRLSETFILSEILELERRGCEVVVFSRYRPAESVPHEALSGLRAPVHDLEPLLQDRLWEALAIHAELSDRDGDRHARARETALGYRSREEARYWLLAGAVAARAREEGIDLLHAHFATGSASVARYASAIAGIPFSFTAHAKDIYARAVDRRRLSDLLEHASAVVTVSDENREFLAKVNPRARVERIYNGLDLDRFPLRTAEPAAGRDPLVLSVARLVEKKGLVHLLDACARLVAGGRKIRCRLVGSGPLEPELRSQVEGLGIRDRVEFVGSASQEEIVQRHLAEAAVYVLPCVVAADGDRDGLPTTLVEAMACGVPVISTDLPGLSEAVPHGRAGLLAPMGDGAALARAIARTLDDAGATRRRALAAREHVERTFDARNNAGTLLSLFRSTLHPAVPSAVRG